jgi:hypothetical protein
LNKKYDIPINIYNIDHTIINIIGGGVSGGFINESKLELFCVIIPIIVPSIIGKDI